MKKALMVMAVLLCATGAAFAEDITTAEEPQQPSDERKIAIALSYGAFFPSDSNIRDDFGDSWTRLSFKTFEPVKPKEWRFIAEAGSYRLSGSVDVRLYPITFGFERALSDNPDLQPYITLRTGPYFGKIEIDDPAFSDSHTGLNANVAVGITFDRRYYAEIRYDYFSRFAGFNFDGISVSAGVRLFNIRI